eukprot:3487253-Rhodomonas_salina.1
MTALPRSSIRVCESLAECSAVHTRCTQVYTVQYFVWYLALLPLALANAHRSLSLYLSLIHISEPTRPRLI